LHCMGVAVASHIVTRPLMTISVLAVAIAAALMCVLVCCWCCCRRCRRKRQVGASQINCTSHMKPHPPTPFTHDPSSTPQPRSPKAPSHQTLGNSAHTIMLITAPLQSPRRPQTLASFWLTWETLQSRRCRRRLGNRHRRRCEGRDRLLEEGAAARAVCPPLPTAPPPPAAR
jgi:hypothetical protein